MDTITGHPSAATAGQSRGTPPSRRFELALGAEADSSWLSFLPAAVVAEARRSALGRRLVGRMLRERHGLDPAGSADERDEKVRLPAAADEVRRVVRALGACALAPLVRRTIDRDRARAAHSAFGDALYARVLRSEEIALDALPRSAWDACSDAEAIRHLAEGIGLALVQACCDGPPSARLRAAALLFPRTVVEGARAAPRALSPAAVRARLIELSTES